MIASQLIARLQSFIDVGNDVEVFFEDKESGGYVEVEIVDFNQNEREDWISLEGRRVR